MKIIILGAGQVGSSVAEHLAGEANDITVVDTRGSCLQDLQDHFDLIYYAAPVPKMPI
jgi:trk system potassium uptake protein TrkA